MESRVRKLFKQPPSNRNPWRFVMGLSAFVLIGWAALLIHGAVARKAVEARLLKHAEQFAQAFTPGMLDARKAGTYVLCATDSIGLGFAVLDSEGISRCSPSSKAWNFSRNESGLESAFGGKPSFIERDDAFGDRELAINFPLTSSAKIVGVVRISQPLAKVEAIHWNIRLQIAWVFLTFILLSFITSLVLILPHHHKE